MCGMKLPQSPTVGRVPDNPAMKKAPFLDYLTPPKTQLPSDFGPEGFSPAGFCAKSGDIWKRNKTAGELIVLNSAA
jgi:hypothetical protein